jgi:glucose-6-phosphate isomerase
LLDGGGTVPTPAFTDGAVEVHAHRRAPAPTGPTPSKRPSRRCSAGLDPEQGYSPVMAYLDRSAMRISPASAGRWESAPVGPRPSAGVRASLHSTASLHKGGAPVGVFLQITGSPAEDLAVPGRDFTFGEFIAAQAVGDGAVLADHDRPVLRLHLTDRAAGLDQVAQVLR